MEDTIRHAWDLGCTEQMGRLRKLAINGEAVLQAVRGSANGETDPRFEALGFTFDKVDRIVEDLGRRNRIVPHSRAGTEEPARTSTRKHHRPPDVMWVRPERTSGSMAAAKPSQPHRNRRRSSLGPVFLATNDTPGWALERAHTLVIQRLFWHYQTVVTRVIAQGEGEEESAILIQCEPISSQAKPLDESITVVRIDSRNSIACEAARYAELAHALGPTCPTVLSTAYVGGIGTLQLRLSGSCWADPQMRASHSVSIISFCSAFLELARRLGEMEKGRSEEMLERFGHAGDPLTLPLQVMSDAEQQEGLGMAALARHLKEGIGEVLGGLRRATARKVQANLMNHHRVHELAAKVLSDADVEDQVIKRNAKLQRLQLLEDEDNDDPALLAQQVVEVTKAPSPEPPSPFATLRAFLSKTSPYAANVEGELHHLCLVHGSMDGASLCRDADGVVWPLDLSKMAVGHTLTDLARLECEVLFTLTVVATEAELHIADHFREALRAPSTRDLRLPLPPSVTLSMGKTSVKFELMWRVLRLIRALVAEIAITTGEHNDSLYRFALLGHLLGLLSKDGFRPRQCDEEDEGSVVATPGPTTHDSRRAEENPRAALPAGGKSKRHSVIVLEADRPQKPVAAQGAAANNPVPSAAVSAGKQQESLPEDPRFAPPGSCQFRWMVGFLNQHCSELQGDIKGAKLVLPSLEQPDEEEQEKAALMRKLSQPSVPKMVLSEQDIGDSTGGDASEAEPADPEPYAAKMEVAATEWEEQNMGYCADPRASLSAADEVHEYGKYYNAVVLHGATADMPLRATCGLNPQVKLGDLRFDVEPLSQEEAAQLQSWLFVEKDPHKGAAAEVEAIKRAEAAKKHEEEEAAAAVAEAAANAAAAAAEAEAAASGEEDDFGTPVEENDVGILVEENDPDIAEHEEGEDAPAEETAEDGAELQSMRLMREDIEAALADVFPGLSLSLAAVQQASEERVKESLEADGDDTSPTEEPSEPSDGLNVLAAENANAAERTGYTAVVLASAGRGKTSLLRKAFLSLAKLGAAPTHGAARVVPLFIRASEFAAILAVDPEVKHHGYKMAEGMDLLGFYLKSRYDLRSGIGRLFATARREKRLVVVLDGLNEAGAEYTLLSSWLTAGPIRQEGAAFLLCSSRPAGFDLGLAASCDALYQILPLGSQERRKTLACQLGSAHPKFTEICVAVDTQLKTAASAVMDAQMILFSCEPQLSPGGDADGDGDDGQPFANLLNSTGLNSDHITLHGHGGVYDRAVIALACPTARNALETPLPTMTAGVEAALRKDMLLLREPHSIRFLARLAYEMHSERSLTISAKSIERLALDMAEVESESLREAEEKLVMDAAFKMATVLVQGTCAGFVPLMRAVAVVAREENDVSTEACWHLEFAHLSVQEHLACVHMTNELYEVMGVPQDALAAGTDEGDSSWELNEDCGDDVITLFTSQGEDRAPLATSVWWQKVIFMLAGRMQTRAFNRVVQELVLTQSNAVSDLVWAAANSTDPTAVRALRIGGALISKKFTNKIPDGRGYLPIHAACAKNRPNANLVQALLAAYPQGAHEAVGRDERLALHIACSNPSINAATVQHVLRVHLGAAETGSGDAGLLPLHLACTMATPSASVVSALVQYFPKAATLTEEHTDRLALHLACAADGQGPDNVIVKKLVAANSSAVEAVDKYKKLPVHIAAAFEPATDYAVAGVRETIVTLLNAAPSTAAATDWRDMTPLHIACSRSMPSTAVVIAMLRANALAAKVRDDEGDLPLHLACRRHCVAGDTGGGVTTRRMSQPQVDTSEGFYLDDEEVDARVVSALLHVHPAGAQAVDSWGSLPLHLACARLRPPPSIAVVRSLMNHHRAGATAKDARGRLPLHEAALAVGPTLDGAEEGVMLSVVRALLASQLEPTHQRRSTSAVAMALSPDDSGKVPLHYACARLPLCTDTVLALLACAPEAAECEDKVRKLCTTEPSRPPAYLT